ncbi:MAG: hypothetical protein GXO86_14015 [Chlorobi bacterium]|nr:hypothetical protein [Chlorobiota bacterium]
MKNIVFYLIVIFGIGLISSCEKVNNNPVLDMSKVIAPELQKPADGSALVLKEENADSVVAFQWTATQYNVEGLQNTTYILQMDFADSNFNKPVDLVSTTGLSYEMTEGAINKRLVSLGMEPDQTYAVAFRILSFLVQNSPDTWVYSKINSVSMTPYKATQPPGEGPDTLWVPGDYQGWNPAAAPNIYSIPKDGKYKGWVYFPDGGTFEFKFTSAPDWNHTNFGYGGDFVLDTDPGAGNLKVPGTGNYLLTIDTVALTWGYELQNFALIGTFNNWEGDEPLTWDDANQWWTITISFTAGTEFKWRANADWAVNFGDNDPPDGTLVQDGANIVVDSDGTYTINLILSESVPRYEIIKQ